MARYSSRYTAKVVDPDPIIRLWMLRILVELGAHRDFILGHGFSNDAIAELLGLSQFIDHSREDFDQRAAQSELRSLHKISELQFGNSSAPACLNGNVRRLSELVGLSAVDCKILEFSVCIQNERILDDTADWLGQLSSVRVFHSLSVILRLPEASIRAAMSSSSILARSGLVSIQRSGTNSLRGKIDLLSDQFADLMSTSEADPVSLLKGTVSAVSSAKLTLADYSHVDESLNILRPYLKQCMELGKSGVNIFVHGVPGTGKSQLSRAIAAELNCELFEVASEDVDGDPVDGEMRLRAYRAGQSFFATRKALMVFDEVEDVFDDGNNVFGRKSVAQERKAWINRMLEENPVPTLWLSNSISGLDPAFIRRFDMVFELPIPPKFKREQILTQSCGDLLDAKDISRIAEVESLAPAVVDKAASVVRLVRSEQSRQETITAFERLINNTLEAQGHRPLIRHDPTRLPEVYDPLFINADADMARITQGLTKVRSGRLCLFGPPGTGKTAYGRWLAKTLDVPLVIKRASDLLSPYVGQNEQHIAKAFRQAAHSNAVLLIDEVDSFLQDRRGAVRSWEVSLVNEMLTQMESYPGVFIASTNLMTGLDQAALRRFDLKVKFDFLKPEQAWELLCRHCENLSLPRPNADLQIELDRVKQLTPGDFAAIVRQHSFRKIDSPHALLLALKAECDLKEGAKAAIGFM